MTDTSENSESPESPEEQPSPSRDADPTPEEAAELLSAGAAPTEREEDDVADLAAVFGRETEPAVEAEEIAATLFLAIPTYLRAKPCADGTVCQSLATWLNSSSTGVSRPKMLTSTLSLSWSSLISAI